MLKSLPEGEYKKKWIREKIGYEDRKNFANVILEQKEVQKYFKENNIISKGQKIIIQGSPTILPTRMIYMIRKIKSKSA